VAAVRTGDYRYLLALKWATLRRLRARRALYIDADTLFFGDVDILFKKFVDFDFYARQEIHTEKNALPGFLDFEMFQEVAIAAHARPKAMFNTGVMLFNERALKSLKSRLRSFDKIFSNLLNGVWNNPCVNHHLAEEVAGSLFVAVPKNIRSQRLPPNLCPWYCELLFGQQETTGVVTHSFSVFYPQFLEKYEGARSLRVFNQLKRAVQMKGK
jgi:hypothetical protein